MKSNILVTSLLLGTAYIFSGCSGDRAQNTPSQATNLSQVSGIVSDGPIKDARVFIDINENGQYDLGEPYDISNENGEYLVEYILDPGREYLLVAEGDSNLKTRDERDNAGRSLNFKMFTSFLSAGSINDLNAEGTTFKKHLNPSVFKAYLQDVNNSQVGNNEIIQNFLMDTQTNDTDLFQKYILDQNLSSVLVVTAEEIKARNETREEVAIREQESSNLLFEIESSNKLKEVLLNGDINQKSIGIKSLIDTKYAFYIVKEYDKVVNNEVSSELSNEEYGFEQNIIYTPKGDIVTARFKSSFRVTQRIDDYIQKEVLAYEGTAMFDSSGEENTLLSAKYAQMHFQENTQSGSNRLDGVIDIIQDDNVYKFNFTKGIFDITTSEYANIKGNIRIRDALTESIPIANSNSVELDQAKITTALRPVKIGTLYPESMIANWSGSFSDSCKDNDGTININILSQYSASWQAQSGSNFYGTDIVVSGTKATLKDETRVWSVADINANSIDGTWSDSINNCNGDFSVTKSF